MQRNPLLRSCSSTSAWAVGPQTPANEVERTELYNTLRSTLVAAGYFEAVTFGFVKWLKPKYGPDVMIEAFARVAEGILVAQKISEAVADDKGVPAERIAMTDGGTIGAATPVEKHGVAAVDDACLAALDLGVVSYRFVRRYLERQPPLPLTLQQVDPLIRELEQYRDIIQQRIKESEAHEPD